MLRVFFFQHIQGQICRIELIIVNLVKTGFDYAQSEGIIDQGVPLAIKLN